MIQGAQPATDAGQQNWLRIGAIVVLAVAVAVIVWLIVKGDDSNSSQSSANAAPPAAATTATLRALPGQLGHRVYWMGPRSGQTYELTQAGPNIYLRYLPSGVSVGSPRPDFLTVGTYPNTKAYRSLKRQARRSGAVSRTIAGGGIAVWSKSRPQSVYFTFPKSQVQVEVYDPSARRARDLVLSGAVKPIR